MSARKRKKHGRKQRWYIRFRLPLALAALAAVLLVIVGVSHRNDRIEAQRIAGIEDAAPELDVQLLTVNEYSRPGIARDEVNGIVIHYTANPGTGAQANRNYFEGLKDSHVTKASAHFIVGLEGEIIQCIPTAEVAYACSERNRDTVSIECCYEKEDGSYNRKTYRSVIRLTAWLCAKFGLDEGDVIRHYDVTGKLCPLYYVEHEDAWDAFRADVAKELKQYE